MLEAAEVGAKFKINPSITRGLDYYTGIVYETFLDDLPGIGSVCSGGRYDNLTSIYARERLPGVGSSIGLDRLMAALEELNMIPKRKTGTAALICFQDTGYLDSYLALTRDFRKAGIACELYPEAKKLPKQFSFAESKGIPFAVICGEEEFRNGTVTVKNLNRRKNYTGLSFGEAVNLIQQDEK